MNSFEELNLFRRSLAVGVPPACGFTTTLQALREKAEQEGRSMQEVARAAIAAYVSGRADRLRSAIDRVRTEDAELLDRLGK